MAALQRSKEEKDYVVIFRGSFTAESEVDARVFAEEIAQDVRRIYVDDESDDEFYLVDIFDVDSTTESPEEEIVKLSVARNILIRVRTSDSYDTARELDKIIHQLRNKLDPEYALVDYDWSKFLEISQQVLSGSNPIN